MGSSGRRAARNPTRGGGIAPSLRVLVTQEAPPATAGGAFWLFWPQEVEQKEGLMRYYCDGFRPVECDSAKEAATIFATRQARREFGRTAYCRTLRLDSWTGNGVVTTFEAFVGRDLFQLTRNPSDRGTTTGHNVWLVVTTR